MFLLIILAHICFMKNSIASSSTSAPFIENKMDMKFDNFEKIDFFYRNKISSIDKFFFNKLNIVLSKKYKGYLMINVCQGRFNDKIRNDYNMTILNLEKRNIAYIVAMKDEKNRIRTFKLQQFDIDLSKSGYIKGRSGENICPSSKEIKRISVDYSKSNNEDGMFTNLKPHTNLDAACVTPAGGDMEFICFEYDKKHREFRNIGGWKNG